MELKLEFMLRAIEIMHESKPEDSEPHPCVGMVIVKGSTKLAEASRGQRQKGEHAEFGGLHHVLLNRDLQGTTLYTTLEPCTSRKHPKLACAEWIISRRITNVVIGILDPNPRICGKGFWMLIQAGIKVHFFPPDLMTRIQRANKVFFDSCQDSLVEDVPTVGTEAAHVEAENSLLSEYLSQPDFPEQCFVAGEWRPNVCFRSFSGARRAEIKKWLKQRPKALPIARRDIFLIKGTNTANQNNLLLYFSGKAQTGWNTWLFPNRKRDHEGNVVERLKAHEEFLCLDLGVKKAEITYARGMPLTVSLKTNRYATASTHREVPKLYVFRYCFVRINSPLPGLLARQYTVTSGDYVRKFQWFSPGVFEQDEKIWKANADVIMSIDKFFETALTKVPSSIGRKKISS